MTTQERIVAGINKDDYISESLRALFDLESEEAVTLYVKNEAAFLDTLSEELQARAKAIRAGAAGYGVDWGAKYTEDEISDRLGLDPSVEYRSERERARNELAEWLWPRP